MNPVSHDVPGLVHQISAERLPAAGQHHKHDVSQADRPDTELSLRPAAIFTPQAPAEAAETVSYSRPAAPRATDAPVDSGAESLETETASSAPETPPDKNTSSPPEAPGAQPERPAEEEKCTTNTDKVDQETENLRRRVSELRQQAATGPDMDCAAREKELKQAERELALKDNDQYRRQHATVTNC